jgi:hypothetical protein
VFGQLDPRHLHHGLYTPLPVRRGDRATCFCRDGDVVIGVWSDGRISWPRCQRPARLQRLGHPHALISVAMCGFGVTLFVARAAVLLFGIDTFQDEQELVVLEIRLKYARPHLEFRRDDTTGPQRPQQHLVRLCICQGSTLTGQSKHYYGPEFPKPKIAIAA